MLKIIWRWKLTIASLLALLVVYNMPQVVASKLDFATLISVFIVASIATVCEITVNGFNRMEKKAE